MRRRVLAFLLIAPTLATADGIDDLALREMRKGQVPGLTLMVLRDGKPVKVKAYGFANLEHRVPAKRETVYELASISKTFTATATLMLVDDGKLRLDESIAKYFPEQASVWGGITLRHLLNHTSGLSQFHFRPDRMSAISFLRYTNQQQLEDIARARPSFTPGTRFQYSNAGYLLLGMIVEKVSGQPFAEFVQQRLLNPLGMTQTRFRQAAAILPNRADGYTLRKDARVRWSLDQALQSLDLDGFGGMLSTVEDLGKWDRAIGEGKLLRSETWRAAWLPARFPDGKSDRYGFGWELRSTPSLGETHFHSGHTGTVFIRVPQHRVTVIVLSNLGIGNPPPYGQDRGWNVVDFGFSIAEKVVAERKGRR